MTIDPSGRPAPRLAAAVAATLASAEELRVYDLGLAIDESMPQWPSGHARFRRRWSSEPGADASLEEATFGVEQISGSLHTSTHIDAVVHVQWRGAIHGGVSVAEAAVDGRFLVGGVESIPPLVLPFVLLDAARAADVDVLPPDAVVDERHVACALELSGQELDPGCAVLVRTGNSRRYAEGDAYLDVQPGLSRDAGLWLQRRGVAVVGSDTAGTEPLPTADASQTLHVALLHDHGVYLVENLDLEDLAADRRTHGVFICLPLKLTGATGSWVRPVALA